MLKRFDLRPSSWRALPEPVLWSPFLGLARSLIALGNLITVLFTSSDFLFRPVAGLGSYPLCTHADRAGLFCAMRGDLDAARVVAVVVLVAVIVGFAPQITSLLHVWVAFSISSSISIPEGGDQIATIMALLLVPVCLTDPRWNHWSPARPGLRARPWRTGFAVIFVVAIKLQLCVLYFYSGAGKLFVTEWAEGTALYYIVQGFFGASGLPRLVLTEVAGTSLGAAALTWGTMLLELGLAAILLTRGRLRLVLALAGVTLHLGIIVAIGLWSFQITMLGGLLLLALPLHSAAYHDGATIRGVLRPGDDERPRTHGAGASGGTGSDQAKVAASITKR
jgi:antimicrobial peptide system SdpB family protein